VGYTTYDFYSKKYYGNSIGESLFPKWNDRASTKLDQLTFGNINEDTVKEYDKQIQKATCALADLLYQIDYNANDEAGANVKSMSSGGRSISFGSNETLVDKVIGDKAAQNRLCYDTACEYMAGTGLLYAGV